MITSIPQFNFDFYSDKESAIQGMPTATPSKQDWQLPLNPYNIKFNFQFALPSIQTATSNTPQNPTTDTGSTNSSTNSTSSSNGSSSQAFKKSFNDFLKAWL